MKNASSNVTFAANKTAVRAMNRAEKVALVASFNNTADVKATRDGIEFRGTPFAAQGVAAEGFDVVALGADRWVARRGR